MKLHGKTAIVTGGARGLGRAAALRLADLGADVAIFDVDLNAAAQYGEPLDAATVADELIARGVRGIQVELDLTRKADTNAAFERVRSEFGRIDVLVNVAGGLTTSGTGAATEIPAEDIRTAMDINLMTMVNCCQAAVPIMRASGGGIIVNVSSTAAITTYPGGRYAGYAVAKAAVAHYTRHLAAEVGPDGIRVNSIAPGVMLTSRIVALAATRGIGKASETAHIPLRRYGKPEDFAGVVEFLTTDLSAYVTGECIPVCGGSLLTGGMQVSAS